MRENINANNNFELQTAIKTMEEIITKFSSYRQNCGVIEPSDTLKAVVPDIFSFLDMEQKVNMIAIWKNLKH